MANVDFSSPLTDRSAAELIKSWRGVMVSVKTAAAAVGYVGVVRAILSLRVIDIDLDRIDSHMNAR